MTSAPVINGMPTPDIDLTVVTVTFNAGKVVERTLNSIAAQQQDGLECLCVDGVSKDNTVEVIEGHRSQIGRLRIVSEPDESLYDAMNKGLLLARGRYILFLNAGDVFVDQDVVADFRRLLVSLPHPPNMVYGHTALHFHDGKKAVRGVRRLGYISHGQPTIHQSVFFRTDTHRAHPYPFRAYPISADYAVMAALQVAPDNQTYTWDRVVAIFQNDPASISNRNLNQRLKDAWLVQKHIIHTTFVQRCMSAARRVLAHVYYNMRTG